MGKLFLFIIYSFLFLCVGGSVISWLMGVSPFSVFSWETKEVYLNPFSDWYVLYKRFWYDNWVVYSASDLSVFFTFLFFFPIYIALWFWVRKVKWFHLLFRHFSFLPLSKAPVLKGDILIKKHFDRPVALRQTKGFGSSVLENISTPSHSSNETPNSENSNTSNASQNVVSQSVGENLISDTLKQQIKELGSQYGYDMFENVLLENINVPLVLATDTVALLLKPLTEKREWIADEMAVDEQSEPTWFSADGLITSPFYQMQKAAEILKLQEPESEVVPVVLLCDGSILNSAALIPQWQEKNGFVALLNDGKGDELLPFSQLLAEKNH